MILWELAKRQCGQTVVRPRRVYIYFGKEYPTTSEKMRKYFLAMIIKLNAACNIEISVGHETEQMPCHVILCHVMPFRSFKQHTKIIK